MEAEMRRQARADPAQQRMRRDYIRRKDEEHRLHFALARTQFLAGQPEAAVLSLERARERAPVEALASYAQPMDQLLAAPLNP